MKIKMIFMMVISVCFFPYFTQAKSLRALAEIQNSKGEKIGEAEFKEKENGVKVEVEVSSISPGNHGIHIHENGKCEIPNFKSAGGHFNPTHKKHGLENPQGSHEGDLPNLVVKKDRTGKIKFTLPSVTLHEGANSLFRKGGTSIVIHEKEDDEKTDPAGNSGDRIACGVIRSSSK